MKPRYFAKPEAFRAWLEDNHAKAKELLVGFHKTGTGRPCMTWPESVDEALSFGWIDGVRRSLGEHAYTIRFTPRKPGSTWSTINVKKAAALIASGRMRPAGLRAFEARRADRTGIYSFERKEPAALTPEHEAILRANTKAAAFFDAQPGSYRRAALHWVVSAKRAETRDKRLAELVRDSDAGRTIKLLTRPTDRAR